MNARQNGKSQEQDSKVQAQQKPARPRLDYEWLRNDAAQLRGYVKVKLDVRAALALADMSPYPRGVRVGVMKQVASAREISLEQMRIMLGWAARKSQHASMR